MHLARLSVWRNCWILRLHQVLDPLFNRALANPCYPQNPRVDHDPTAQGLQHRLHCVVRHRVKLSARPGKGEDGLSVLPSHEPWGRAVRVRNQLSACRLLRLPSIRLHPGVIPRSKPSSKPLLNLRNRFQRVVQCQRNRIAGQVIRRRPKPADTNHHVRPRKGLPKYLNNPVQVVPNRLAMPTPNSAFRQNPRHRHRMRIRNLPQQQLRPNRDDFSVHQLNHHRPKHAEGELQVLVSEVGMSDQA